MRPFPLIFIALLLFGCFCLSEAKKKKKDKDKDGKKDDKDEPAEPESDTNLQFVLSARSLPSHTGGLNILSGGSNDFFIQIEYWPSIKADQDVKTFFTSLQKDTVSPDWPDVLRVKYIEGEGQRVKFTVRNADGSESGRASSNLKKIYNAAGNEYSLELVGKGGNAGKLVLNTLVENKMNDDTDDRFFGLKKLDKNLIVSLNRKGKKVKAGAKKIKFEDTKGEEEEDEDDKKDKDKSDEDDDKKKKKKD